ncbi:MAG: protein translocase subunit SecD [Anaerolineae bacterium]
MQPRDIRLLAVIAVLVAFAIWVALPDNPGIRIGDWERDIRIHQGLDLQGGMQVLLEADLAEDQEVSADAMEATAKVVENRVNGLGVTEPVVQRVGSRRILVELPGIEDPETAVETLREMALMEWVDVGSQWLEPGTIVRTDVETAEGAETGDETATVFHTVLTGANLRNANVAFDQAGRPIIAFELDNEGAQIFAEHTAANIGRFLAIVLDKQVISCPRISTTIPDGRGQIEGQFTLEEARAIVLQLQYGALPVPLRILDTRAVGPSLGQDSVQKSVRAGAIGLVTVLLFMLLYYRLPGFLADLALIIYALLNLALYKLVPITLTLPGIAGFLLSVGMAVDANVLIFERMREELRAGRTLQSSIRAGFGRAWTPILDSGISTWITCLILWVFGNSFGASMVKGFALTLAVGVGVNMFTAVLVTRTFVHTVFGLTGEKLRQVKWLLGV